MIKRPKKVERNQKGYLTNEKYQDYAENQFKEIYDYLDKLKGGDGGVPIGSGRDYYGTTEPEGYMFADGRAISKTEYAELFAVIGDLYRKPDNTDDSTFNIPDKRERVTISASDNYSVGATGGENTHTLSQAELPKTEGQINFADTILALDTRDGGIISGTSGVFSAVRTTSNQAISNVGLSYYSHIKGAKMSFGNNQAHNNMQLYLVCNHIIKVK